VDIRENLIARRKLLEALKERFLKPRGGWHVTDLLVCPRKTYFRRIGEYEFMQDEAVLLFTAGRAHHDILEYLPLREFRVEKDGIEGHIDMIGDRVTEIFTTRTPKTKNPEDFKMKIMQLEAYLAMVHETEGDLMVFYLMGAWGKDILPDVKIFTVSFEEDEIKEHWSNLVRRKKMLEECIKKRKPPEETGFPWECKNCGFKYKCHISGGLEMIEKERERLRKELEVMKGEIE